jgi:hypothetical protein
MRSRLFKMQTQGFTEGIINYIPHYSSAGRNYCACLLKHKRHKGKTVKKSLRLTRHCNKIQKLYRIEKLIKDLPIR